MASRKNIFKKKYIGKDYVAFGSDLALNKDIAWEKISRRAKRSILAAREIKNLKIEKKKGTKTELDQFRTIWYDPKDPELGTEGFQKNQHVYFAYLEGELVAGIVVTEVDTILFLHFNGGTEKAKDLQIPSLMIWHIVEEFHNSKFKYLDIGCSFRKSLQDYFKNWATYEYPIIYHPPYLTPRIDLAPFDSHSFGMEADLSIDVDKEIKRKAGGKPFTYFPSGKHAIFAAIKNLGLSKEDEVYITTTTGSPYISSCVTTAIEEVAPWSREMSVKTKAIFVIHEFGFVHEEIEALQKTAKEKGIPLIEDCAYAFNSGKAGTYGDYVIYSFPKYFPVQYGGLLVGAHFEDQYIWDTFQCLDGGKREIVKSQLSSCIATEENAAKKRRENYAHFEKLFGEEGYEAFFKLKEDEVPGAFVLKMRNTERMKEISSRLDYFGIECGAFHHNDAIFFPVHQNLTKKHVEYIYAAVRGGLRIDGWVIPPAEFLALNDSSKKSEDRPESRWKKN